jgi:hypothetical protein
VLSAGLFSCAAPQEYFPESHPNEVAFFRVWWPEALRLMIDLMLSYATYF